MDRAGRAERRIRASGKWAVGCGAGGQICQFWLVPPYRGLTLPSRLVLVWWWAGMPPGSVESGAVPYVYLCAGHAVVGG